MCPMRGPVPAAEADRALPKANAVFSNFGVRPQDRCWDRERAAAFVCSRKHTFESALEAAQDPAATPCSRENEQIAKPYRVANPCALFVAGRDIFPVGLGSRDPCSDLRRRIMFE